MPCYNESATIGEIVKRVLGESPHRRASHRRRRLDRRHARPAVGLRRRPGPCAPATREPGQGRGASAAASREAAERLRDRAGRRPRVRPRRLRPRARAAPRRRRRRGLRQPLPVRPAASGPVLLALGGQPDAHRCSPTCSPTSTSPTWRPASRRSAREVVKSLDLREDRFGIEPEITAQGRRRRLAGVGGRDLLLRPHLRRGQEDQLARRRRRRPLHRQVRAGVASPPPQPPPRLTRPFRTARDPGARPIRSTPGPRRRDGTRT